ncbi:MAG TPA: sigma-70 family RNA polymerase sigma factor [Candidatus Aquilonibacter sp.]|nr:sigma-70 family RNA polymerase sigma factor [Candidatus Aquilonibacter sp.]
MSVGVKLKAVLQTDWSDERLVSACLKGDAEAWSALIAKYKNLIYSIPIRMGMYEEAADIFQSVCLELLSGLSQLREPRALPKWLMQACYHVCLQQRREPNREVPLTNETGEDLPIASDEPIPEQLLAELEKEQMLRDAIAQLPERCQRLVHKLFYESPPRPYEEIARELELATGSIGFIRGRCLQKLKKQLLKMGF